MTPLKWRKKRGETHRTATVEGVDVRRYDLSLSVILRVVYGSKWVDLSLRTDSSRMQIDAAAWSLADLVATLRGME